MHAIIELLALWKYVYIIQIPLNHFEYLKRLWWIHC